MKEGEGGVSLHSIRLYFENGIEVLQMKEGGGGGRMKLSMGSMGKDADGVLKR